MLLALLSQGTQVQRDSYSQCVLHLRQTCRWIVYLIWASRLRSPQTPWIATPTTTRASSASTTKRDRAGNKTTTHRKTQKKYEQRMVLRGVRVPFMLTPERFTSPKTSSRQEAICHPNGRRYGQTSTHDSVTDPSAKIQETDRYHGATPAL